MQPPSNIELPRSLAFGLPLFAIFGLLILDLVMPGGEFREVWIDSEHGLIENLTVLFALLGLCLAVAGARRAWSLELPWLVLWCALFGLGFLYIASEEASWGQHWVSWETPEWLAKHNRYGEANLHNISYRVDRIPKSIVGACIVIGGIGWPLFRSWLEPRLPGALRWSTWILPPRAALPMAVGFFVMWLVNRGFVAFDLYKQGGDGFAGQEHMELLITTYLLLYILALARSLKDRQSGSAARATA